jgi:hypothetical protein
MTTAVTVHPTDTPAAELPFSMAVDVHAVLTAHGLHADMVDVLSAVWRIVQATPTARGGTADRADAIQGEAR